MRAPRCPPIHKSCTDWETWICKYMDYKENVYLPRHLHLFDTYKNSTDFLQNIDEHILMNNWKYLTYEWLTGRTHHILTFR
jgi:hypothetical protein